MRRIVFDEVGHVVEVDDFPRRDVKRAGDQRDQNSDGERPAEGDRAAVVLPIRADAEEDKDE